MLIQSTMESQKRLGQVPLSELNFKVILKVTKVENRVLASLMKLVYLAT